MLRASAGDAKVSPTASPSDQGQFGDIQMPSRCTFGCRTLSLGEKLGHGSYGQVFAAVDDSRQAFAVKFNKVDCDAGLQSLASEFEILSSMRDANVLSAFALVGSAPRFALVLERCDATLSTWLRENPMPKQPASAMVRARWGFFLQLCCGLSYVHSKNVIHLDLKPANMLMSHKRTSEESTAGESSCLKLSDFGLSAILGSSAAVRRPGNSAYTSAYRPWELWQAGSKEVMISYHCELWALACVGYDLLAISGSRYLMVDPAQMQELGCALPVTQHMAKARLAARIGYDVTAQKLITSCLQAPRSRPSLAAFARSCKDKLRSL